MKARGFIYGSIFMVLINFIVRTVDFVYDVMLSKYIGAEGLGLAHMARSVLMIFIVISSAGIPTAIVRLVAEYKSKNDYFTIKKILRVSFLLALTFGIVFSLIIGFFGNFIAINIYKNESIIVLIYFLIPAVILLPLTITFRGYYYGLRIITVPNVSQIIEHVAQLIIVFLMLTLSQPITPIKGALIAICGISIGEVFDLIWLTSMLKKTNKRMMNIPYRKKSAFEILKQLFSISAPIALADVIGVLLRFANSIFIPRKLMDIGYSYREAVSTLGRISGMAMPLIALTFIVTGAVVTNIVPNLSENMATKRYHKVKRDITFAFKMTLLAAIPLSIIYLVYAEPLGYYIYEDSQVSYFIRALSLGSVFLSLEHTFSGILNGLNKQVAATINRLIGLGIQVFCIYSLIGNPKFGINGFFIGFFLSSITIFLLDSIIIRKKIKLGLDFRDIILKPILSSFIMLIAIYSSMEILEGFSLGASTKFFLSLGVGGVAYIIMLFITNAIPKNTVKRLKKGNI